jgi:hypothetical protein
MMEDQLWKMHCAVGIMSQLSTQTNCQRRHCWSRSRRSIHFRLLAAEFPACAHGWIQHSCRGARDYTSYVTELNELAVREESGAVPLLHANVRTRMYQPDEEWETIYLGACSLR